MENTNIWGSGVNFLVINELTWTKNITVVFASTIFKNQNLGHG